MNLMVASLACIDQRHLVLIVEAPDITGLLTVYRWNYSGSKISATITTPVMWHMSEPTSSKSVTRKEWHYS